MLYTLNASEENSGSELSSRYKLLCQGMEEKGGE